MIYFFIYLQEALNSCNLEYYQTASKSARNIEQFKVKTKPIEDSWFPWGSKESFKLNKDTQSIQSAKKTEKNNSWHS